MSKNTKPVVILGGGLAGLTAANHLRRQNVPVVLYDAGNKIAGLARSFHDDEGFTYDFGAHFITNRLAETVGIRGKCRTVKHYAETVWLGGKSYSHPVGLMKVPRMTLDGISAKASGLSRRNKTPNSAAEWFRSNYGDSLANEVAIPLTEAWSGVAAEDLSPAVGDGISSGIARTLWLKAASRLTRRAVACGYSRELPEKASVYHVYPEGGIGSLCQKLAEGLDDVIELESPVEKIIVEGNKVIGVRVAGRFEEASAVISTAPVHVLGKIVEGSDALSHLSNFRYRPMVFVNLRMLGRGLLPDVVTWTPESDFPFFRLTETPLSMPWLAPGGKTIITVDIGCEKGDPFWEMDDEALGELCIDKLKQLIPDARERYQGCRVMRTPIAYPVFLRQYENERQNLANGTGIQNLQTIGRNGEFSHSFMEDVHCRTKQKMDQVVRSFASERIGRPMRSVPTKRSVVGAAGAGLNGVEKQLRPTQEAGFATRSHVNAVDRPSHQSRRLEQQVMIGAVLAFGALIFWLAFTSLVFVIQHPEVSRSYRLFGSLSLTTTIAAYFFLRFEKQSLEA